jgi:mono/diheme cytochrome c family protein
VLYAFDALTFKLLWKSAPDELAPTGKYNEPAIARGVVYVGTDRIQAFGLLPADQTSGPVFPSPYANIAQYEEKPPAVDPKVLEAGKTLVTQRCAVCHNSGQPGIPTLETISKLEGPRIVDALLTGVMVPQAAGLTRMDVRSIAAYLKSLPVATAPAGK